MSHDLLLPAADSDARTFHRFFCRCRPRRFGAREHDAITASRRPGRRGRHRRRPRIGGRAPGQRRRHRGRWRRHHAQAPEARRTPRADPADAGRDARGAGRRTHHDRRARGEAVRQRGRALSAFREQGADVRRPDRVHRVEHLHADPPDHRTRHRPVVAGPPHRFHAVAIRREESRHGARDGRRRARVRERAPVRAHEPVLRQDRIAAAPVPARGGRTRRVADPHGRCQRTCLGTHRARGRTAPALHPFGLQAQPDGADRHGARAADQTAGPRAELAVVHCPSGHGGILQG